MNRNNNHIYIYIYITEVCIFIWFKMIFEMSDRPAKNCQTVRSKFPITNHNINHFVYILPCLTWPHSKERQRLDHSGFGMYSTARAPNVHVGPTKYVNPTVWLYLMVQTSRYEWYRGLQPEHNVSVKRRYENWNSSGNENLRVKSSSVPFSNQFLSFLFLWIVCLINRFQKVRETKLEAPALLLLLPGQAGPRLACSSRHWRLRQAITSYVLLSRY